MMKNFWGLTLHIDMPLLWLQPNSSSEPPKTSIDSPGPSTCTSKEETHPSASQDIRPLPEAGPRKIQNANKKKRTTAILIDTPLKML